MALREKDPQQAIQEAKAAEAKRQEAYESVARLDRLFNRTPAVGKNAVDGNAAESNVRARSTWPPRYRDVGISPSTAPAAAQQIKGTVGKPLSETTPATASDTLRRIRAQTIEELFATPCEGKADASADGEANPIREAMRKAGLKKAPYGRGRQDDELAEGEQSRITASEQRSIARSKKLKPDDPSLLRAILSYYRGQVAERRRVFHEFFIQWSKTELRLLLEHYEAHRKMRRAENAMKDKGQENKCSVAPSRLSLEQHPFVSRCKEWCDILDSNPFAEHILRQTIIDLEAENPIDKAAVWAAMVEEYRLRLEAESRE